MKWGMIQTYWRIRDRRNFQNKVHKDRIQVCYERSELKWKTTGSTLPHSKWIINKTTLTVPDLAFRVIWFSCSDHNYFTLSLNRKRINEARCFWFGQFWCTNILISLNGMDWWIDWCKAVSIGCEGSTTCISMRINYVLVIYSIMKENMHWSFNVLRLLTVWHKFGLFVLYSRILLTIDSLAFSRLSHMCLVYITIGQHMLLLWLSLIRIAAEQRCGHSRSWRVT